MSEKEITKTVDMVAYEDSEEVNLYDWVESVTGVNVTETETVEEEEVTIVVDAGRGEEEFELWRHSYSEEGLEAVKKEVDNNRVRVERETTSEEKKVNSESEAARTLLEEVAEEAIPDEFDAGGVTFTEDQKFFRNWKWVSEDREHKVRFYSVRDAFDERRVLSKEEKRESDDLYETMAEYPSLSFSIKMESTSEEAINGLSEGFIPRVHKELARREAVGKVRYMACEVQETKQGECYDLN